jgi:hypothetical protein
MTQIAIVQAAPRPTPPEGPPSSNNQTSFSPHLENAVRGESQAPNNTSSDESTQIDPYPDDTSDTTPGSNVFSSNAPIENPTSQIKNTDSNWNRQADGADTLKHLKQLRTELTTTDAKITPSLPQSSAHRGDTPFKINIAFTDNQGNTIQPAPLTENDGILRQLQQIIHNSSETGTVSIQGTVNGFSGGLAGDKSGRFSSQVREPHLIFEKTGQKTQTLRQDALAQYLDAKVNTREQGNNSSNTTNSEQQNGANSQQFSTHLQPNASLSTEQTAGFQHVSTLLQDLPGSHAQNSGKSIILSSGNVVYEEDIMHQVVERFQIFKQQNDTRLTLKLHPAELGALQIDLTVKEGSIKANVLAQSQQIQEIVERNLPKLRNSLAEQGFTIEEILVTSQTDSITDFNLFEQHLADRNNYTPAVREVKEPNSFSMVLEDAVEETIGWKTGVNIKV